MLPLVIRNVMSQKQQLTLVFFSSPSTTPLVCKCFTPAIEGYEKKKSSECMSVTETPYLGDVCHILTMSVTETPYVGDTCHILIMFITQIYEHQK